MSETSEFVWPVVSVAEANAWLTAPGDEEGLLFIIDRAKDMLIRGGVRERLGAYKVPVKVVFWPEILPCNANGKILKTELKKVFAPEIRPA